MNSIVEKVILENLLYNENYTRKVVPFLKDEYFQSKEDKVIYKTISEFVSKYNKLPTKEALLVDLSNNKNLTQQEYDSMLQKINDYSTSEQDEQWLVNETEKFCKDKAIYNAILESIHIIDGKSKTQTKEALPSILSDALAVSFDTNIGHDYLKDAERRYEFYHTIEKKIPFDLEFFNDITKGGVATKTLNIVIAGTGVGKSLFLCHQAANCLIQNKNVLYITCEMAEERIAERIDANIMDITIDELKSLPKQVYAKKLFNATRGVTGKLIIKEYPTATAHVNHFRYLVNELKLKKKFIPDIIFIDYLNICASARMKQGGSVNSYTYIKSIAEELRGLAVELGVPVFSATQVNREGYNNTDFGLENTSESFGLPATADFMFAIIATEDLDKRNQVMVKQLKNRYNDLASNRKFVIGINRAKMKLYNLDASAQDGLTGTGEDEDVGSEGHDNKYTSKFSVRKFKKSEDWSN
jgi:replicative DNA helicase